MKALKWKSFNTKISLFCHWENGLYYYLQTVDGLRLLQCSMQNKEPFIDFITLSTAKLLIVKHGISQIVCSPV